MQAKTKALIVVIIFVLLLIAGIGYLSYLGLREDPERVERVTSEAQVYLDEHFDFNATVVDTLYDNASIYDQFTYAAIIEEEGNENFRFLVFEHLQTGEYMDSYVAEYWEYELETYLTPKLREAFGDNSIRELWITYPKDIGHELNIDYKNIPSLADHDAYPIVRITLNRGKEDMDEQNLDNLIEEMKEDLKITNGNITLIFSDNSLIFKDKNIRKNIE